jgi:ethanolamine ammonia-lyase small subunit
MSERDDQLRKRVEAAVQAALREAVSEEKAARAREREERKEAPGRGSRPRVEGAHAEEHRRAGLREPRHTEEQGRTGRGGEREKQPAPPDEPGRRLQRGEAPLLPGLARLANPGGLAALRRATPARIGVGRAGLRYPTETYLTLRADHGRAKDAVASVIDPSFVRGLGALELHTEAKDLQTFLLEPEKGRHLDAESLARLRAEGTRGADVQIILADGLSAWAHTYNPQLLAHLTSEIQRAGFRVGRPLWVHRGRIAVADQIGVELGARATVIGLGERPGLGTGDSLSLYLAWAPKLGQDNAEKNCISNVRPAGFSTEEAARQAAQLLQRASELGRGGLALGAPRRTW